MTTTLTIQETGTTLTVASTLRMTASEAETLLDGVFEPVLGNPGTNGYVLSSTTAGVRSWVEQSGGGGGDVDDLTTTSGSSPDMLRVAAAGGLEYRTTAQVLADIGAAPTASPTFTGTVTLPTTVASVIKPASDSTTALQLANAAGSAVLTVDTTNKTVTAPRTVIDFSATANDQPALYIKVNASASSGVANITLDAVSNQPAYGIRIISNPYAADFFKSSGSLNFATASTYEIKFSPGGYAAPKFRILTSGLTAIGHGTTPTAYADIAASTTDAASLRIRSGTAPTSPNSGDLWFDGTNLKFYDGTTTRTLSWT